MKLNPMELSPLRISYYFISWEGPSVHRCMILAHAAYSSYYLVSLYLCFRDISVIDLEKVMGFIMNTPSDYMFAGFIPLGLKRKHWYAVRKIDDNYYNLNSKLKKPECLGNACQLITYLQNQLSCKDKELLVIVEDGVNIYPQQAHVPNEDPVESSPNTDTAISNDTAKTTPSSASVHTKETNVSTDNNSPPNSTDAHSKFY